MEKIIIIALTSLMAFSVQAKMSLDDVNKNLGVETHYDSISPDQIEREWRSNSKLPVANTNSQSSAYSMEYNRTGKRRIGYYHYCGWAGTTQWNSGDSSGIKRVWKEGGQGSDRKYAWYVINQGEGDQKVYVTCYNNG